MTTTLEKPRAAKAATKSKTKQGAPAAHPRVKFDDPIVKLPLDQIARHPANRRPTAAAVSELEKSLTERGQLEPIVVTLLDAPDGDATYRLVSGETRWLAAGALGWNTIDARVVECDASQALCLLARFNADRTDLTPIDKAELIERLCQPVAAGGAGLTREQAALEVGLNTGSAASNLVRLLQLPEPWRSRVASGELPESFGRALVPWLPLGKHFLSELNTEWVELKKERAAVDGDRDVRREDWLWKLRQAADEVAVDLSDSGVSFPENTIGNAHRTWGKNPVKLGRGDVDERIGLVRIECDGEKLAYATNREAYYALAKEALAKTAARKGKADDPEEEQRRSPQEQARRDKARAESVDRKIAQWRHEWILALVALRLKEVDGLALRLALWMFSWTYHASRRHRAEFEGQLLSLAGSKSERYYDDYGWSAICGKRSGPTLRDRSGAHGSGADDLILDWLRGMLTHEDSDPRQPAIPHAVSQDMVERLPLDLADEWLKLQSGKQPAERFRTFFALLPTDRLQALGKELEVPLAGYDTRAKIVQAFGTQQKILRLPKCLAKPAKDRGAR